MNHRKNTRTKYVLLAPVSAAAVTLAALASDPPSTPASESAPQQMPPEIAARVAASQGEGGDAKKDDFPKFEDVSKEYTKVISTTDGEASLYTLYTRQKDGQMLAELPRNFETQRLFFAFTISGGIPTAGVQAGDMLSLIHI